MKSKSSRESINLRVVKFELDFTPQIPRNEETKKKPKKIILPEIQSIRRKRAEIPSPPLGKRKNNQIDVKDLMKQLIEEIYSDQRECVHSFTDCCQCSISASYSSNQSVCGETNNSIERNFLESLSITDLQEQVVEWQSSLLFNGKRLSRCVRVKDRLRRQQKRLCVAVTIILRHITGDPNARFTVAPPPGEEAPGESGYSEWLHAMRLVARLPAGVPQHFRTKLWLTLAERHLKSRGIDWPQAERNCFKGTAQPDDSELGAQIIKDLHRTGCSLFCGAEGRENQAMLRRVLLAYARWNKDVGYCQGFNMLAAIILEVMDKSESDSLKVMIYLVEAVLPEGYFADDLRGLSADMAAFRDLLRLRLPRLANHMDHLQRISDGGGVEPPLPDVFTMQWFLTLYSTWLQRESLLRIWDLVLLDGNEILLLTALAIWDMLQDRILSARSADEFYSCMGGGGAGTVWASGEALVARVVALGAAPELPRLRSRHRYEVTPPRQPVTANTAPPIHHAMQSMTKRGLRLFYSEDEGDSSDDGSKMALATILPRRDERLVAGDRLTLDIGALKRQYARLRERQRQAHVILAAACARHAAVGVPTSPTSLTVNSLLLGKSAIVSTRGRRLGPPPGAVPPTRKTLKTEKVDSDKTDKSWVEEKSKKSLSRRNSIKWKDIKKEKHKDKKRKTSIDLDEAGDGVIVSEVEANQIVASVRSRSSSETSSYSSRSQSSSSDTSLCDENCSDLDHETTNDIKKLDSVDSKSLTKKSEQSYLKSPNSQPINSTDTIPISNKKEISPSPSKETSKLSTNIDDYLDSAAGEPLRTYIDGFETTFESKNLIESQSPNSLKSYDNCPDKLNKEVEPLKTQTDNIGAIYNLTSLIKPQSPQSDYGEYKINASESLRTYIDSFETMSDSTSLVKPQSPQSIKIDDDYGEYKSNAGESLRTYIDSFETMSDSKSLVKPQSPQSIKIDEDYGEYKSNAGESLRTYIDSFETMSDSKSLVKPQSPQSIKIDEDYGEYKSNAGESLRTYIDSFETMSDSKSLVKPQSPQSIKIDEDYGEYKSNAGESLRTYIDSFETMTDSTSLTKPQSPFSFNIDNECSDLSLIEKEIINPYEFADSSEFKKKSNEFNVKEISSSSDVSKTINISKSPVKYTHLSPLNISLPKLNNVKITIANTNYEYKTNNPIYCTSASIHRHLDIIDTFTMYPNFIPDIDLSEKNLSDFESPPKSPGKESIVLSEDEPLIPLNIDKYFEHSPEFFGARITDPNSSEIPNRRALKRLCRPPRKPDSLTLHSSYSENLKSARVDISRALSYPQGQFYKESMFISTKDRIHLDYTENKKSESECIQSPNIFVSKDSIKSKESMSPKDYILSTGRKNSERALQIIQENSKILSRILTKQNLTATVNNENSIEESNDESKDKSIENKLFDTSLLKESTSDSLIGYIKKESENETSDKNDYLKTRPISIDDPFSLEIRNISLSKETDKSPIHSSLGNKTDFYGWENKGFLAKHDTNKEQTDCDFGDDSYTSRRTDFTEEPKTETGDITTDEISRSSVTLPLSENKDSSPYGRRFTYEEYNYPLSSKYNECVVSKAVEKVLDTLTKTDKSQDSEFAHVVTSSISFTYEPSAGESSPTGVKSNSDDTLCQITSLDQVSTPISPKVFFNKEPSLIFKDSVEKSDKMKLESDDTCSAITPMPETETISSLSCTRSPSTGSYHPFPTRPSMRGKELGVKLGMYPKDSIASPK